MNLYGGLNQMMDYIEEHLEEDISYSKLAQFLGCNSYTMQRIFSLMVGFTITEYIRRRRMSLAVLKLERGERGIDVASFCGYSSQEAFSRKFFQIYKVHPKDVKKKRIEFTFQPILKFTEQKQEEEITYRIEETEEHFLNGEFIVVKGEIPPKAEVFWKEMKEKYPILLKQIPRYAVIDEKEDCTHYWILVKEKIPHLKEFKISKGKWLIFKGNSFEGSKIAHLWDSIYDHYLLSIPYQNKDSYTLEVYYEDFVELWIPLI